MSSSMIVLLVAGGVCLAGSSNMQTTSAFVPSSTSSYNSNTMRTSVSSPLQATKLLSSIPTIPNPFQQLPWNVEKTQRRTARKLKLERSKLHRELGIAEDATYEQIIEATQILTARAEGDKKREIQIEVIKDKILQIRLNERLAGLMSDIVTKDAKAQSGFESTGNALEDGIMEAKVEQSKDKGWNAPAWTNGLVVKPDQAQIKGQVRLWGILSLIGLALPPFIQYSNRFTWLVCIAQLSFRGMPKEQLEGGGIAMSFGGGPGSKSHIKTAWLLGLATSLAGAFLTYGLMPNWAKGQRMTPICVYTMRNFLYGVACCYFQPYKKK